MAACEAVARLQRAPSKPVEMLNPEGLPNQPGQSQIALIAAPRLVFTGTQVCFGFQEADARLAFERLRKAVEQAGGSASQIAFASFYPLSNSIAAQVRKVRAEFFNAARPPAGSMINFESLPSMDAGFAVDAVAIKE
jgi:enamine deaminase RidA (YjgF/YER057c/UK114 family)